MYILQLKLLIIKMNKLKKKLNRRIKHRENQILKSLVEKELLEETVGNFHNKIRGEAALPSSP
jgi:hypothetical protein